MTVRSHQDELDQQVKQTRREARPGCARLDEPSLPVGPGHLSKTPASIKSRMKGFCPTHLELHTLLNSPLLHPACALAKSPPEETLSLSASW